MESWAGVLILLAVLAIVGILRATSDPSRVIGGMWRYRAPDWPSGVQEDDDAHWSWSNAAQRAAREDEQDVAPNPPDPGDEGLTVDVAPIGYEVRSPDRDRS